MKYAIVLMGALLFFGANASAQEEAATEPAEAAETTQAAEPAQPAEEPAAEAPSEEKRSPYYRKVRGWLWLEGVAGPSSYDPDQFGSLSIGQTTGGAPKERGPLFGFALGTGFGGGFFLGWYYHQANYSQYKLFKTGVEFQPTIRIPYVHIMFRIDIGYAKMSGTNPWGLLNMNNGGLDTTFGVGLRIPLVRWMSIAATFDWSYIGLSMRGDDPMSGARVDQWISGQQLAGTFALTFHFIGVRKD